MTDRNGYRIHSWRADMAFAQPGKFRRDVCRIMSSLLAKGEGIRLSASLQVAARASKRKEHKETAKFD